MARIKKVKEVEQVEIPEIEDEGLKAFLAETPHKVTGLGETIDADGEVTYRCAWMFSLSCKSCGKPRCTRIIYKLDENAMLFYRTCKEVEAQEFEDIELIKGQMEV